MPQATALTLNNGTADVVFTPVSISPTQAVFQDEAQGVIAKRSQVILDKPATEMAEIRRGGRVKTVASRTVADVEKLLQGTLAINVTTHREMTKAERTQLRKLGVALLDSLLFSDVVDTPTWVF